MRANPPRSHGSVSASTSVGHSGHGARRTANVEDGLRAPRLDHAQHRRRVGAEAAIAKERDLWAGIS